MKDNSLIPAAALSYLNELLDGGPEISPGLLWFVDRFAKMTANMQEIIANPKTSKVKREHIQIAITSPEFRGTQEYLLEQVERVRRLRDDPDMKKAYTLLTSKLNDERQLRGFLSAALRASNDFSPHRDENNEGAVLLKDIAASSKELHDLLKKLQKLSRFPVPAEVFSIRRLLANTSLDDAFFVKRNIWIELRQHILGLEPPIDGTAQKNSLDKQHPLLSEIAKEDFDRISKQFQSFQANFLGAEDELQMAWAVAPELPDILKTLERAAVGYEVRQPGMIGVAINNRSKLRKTTYIRTLGYALFQEHNIILSAPVRDAIATVTRVVLHDPEIHPNEDDVRKALKVMKKDYPDIRLD